MLSVFLATISIAPVHGMRIDSLAWVIPKDRWWEGSNEFVLEGLYHLSQRAPTIWRQVINILTSSPSTKNTLTP